jgi:hypothetical protein
LEREENSARKYYPEEKTRAPVEVAIMVAQVGRGQKNMNDRLLIGVLGNRNSGKSYTWNTLFGSTVKRGKYPRRLELRRNECVDVFLVSGSFEERSEYAENILKDQNCRIVLCSLQYTEEVHETLRYLIGQNFFLYIQWLNPGHHDNGQNFDSLGLVNQILATPSAMTMRSGRINPSSRVQEIREFIYGWACYRKLITPCHIISS